MTPRCRSCSIDKDLNPVERLGEITGEVPVSQYQATCVRLKDYGSSS